MQLSPAAMAAKEMLRRRAARTNVISFAETIEVPGRSGTDDDEFEDEAIPVDQRQVLLAYHHKLILQKMDECSKRPYGRLMIMAPPGSAKSTYASIVFPADYLGKNKGARFILASYGDTLAVKMGRRTKTICGQARFHSIHNATLRADSKANDNFTLTNGSEYMACGILGGITGNRANGIVIDDPIKGREQADSKVIRDKTWNAYEDDLKTRLIPGGWMVIINTRWHEDDLCGRILPDTWKGESGMIACKDGNDWEVLCLQAECQVDDDPLGRARGEYIWPEWFTKKHWDQFKLNARTWASLFQQLPTPAEGDMFKPDNIEIIEELWAGRITWVRGWDIAATDDDGDWTAGVRLGRHESGRFVISNVRRKQYGPERRDKLLLTTAQADGRGVKQDFPQDPGAAGKGQILGWVKMLVGYGVVWSLETGAKEVRAEGVAAQVNVGNVYMLRGDWNEIFREELRGFPNAKWDDQVDALSRAFNRLMEIPAKMRITQDLLNKARQ